MKFNRMKSRLTGYACLSLKSKINLEENLYRKFTHSHASLFISLRLRCSRERQSSELHNRYRVFSSSRNCPFVYSIGIEMQHAVQLLLEESPWDAPRFCTGYCDQVFRWPNEISPSCEQDHPMPSIELQSSHPYWIRCCWPASVCPCRVQVAVWRQPSWAYDEVQHDWSSFLVSGQNHDGKDQCWPWPEHVDRAFSFVHQDRWRSSTKKFPVWILPVDSVGESVERHRERQNYWSQWTSSIFRGNHRAQILLVVYVWQAVEKWACVVLAALEMLAFDQRYVLHWVLTVEDDSDRSVFSSSRYHRETS